MIRLSHHPMYAAVQASEAKPSQARSTSSSMLVRDAAFAGSTRTGQSPSKSVRTPLIGPTISAFTMMCLILQIMSLGETVMLLIEGF